MKRASYRAAIFWIAHNDSAGDYNALKVEDVANLVSVALIADIFHKGQLQVARDVVKFRKKNKLCKYAESFEG